MSTIPLMRAQRNLLADILAGSPVQADQLTHADGPKSLAASLSFLTRKGQIEDVTTAEADIKTYQITQDGKDSVKRHDDILESIFNKAEAAGIPVDRKDEAIAKDIADHVATEEQGVKRLRKLAVKAGWEAPEAEAVETVAASVSADEPSEVADEPRGKKRKTA